MSCLAVVPARRAQSTLAATLRGLLDGNGDFVQRIIVVTSEGDPSAAVAAQYAGVEVARAQTPLSAGRARNLGRRLAGGGAELLLFVDADCVLEAGGASALARELACEGAAAVAARVRRRGGGLVAWLRHALEFKEAEGLSAPPAGWMPPSTTMLCRTSDFDAVGGFPDLWPGEDLVFVHRLRSRGAAVLLSRNVQTYHRHPDGFAEMLCHQRRLGYTAALARRLTGMKGAVFVRRPWLVPLLLPARLGRALVWFARASPRQLLLLLALLPLYTLGLAAWTLGFAAGARSPASGIAAQPGAC